VFHSCSAPQEVETIRHIPGEFCSRLGLTARFQCSWHLGLNSVVSRRSVWCLHKPSTVWSKELSHYRACSGVIFTIRSKKSTSIKICALIQDKKTSTYCNGAIFEEETPANLPAEATLRCCACTWWIERTRTKTHQQSVTTASF
jgi:hypothetical protein